MTIEKLICVCAIILTCTSCGGPRFPVEKLTSCFGDSRFEMTDPNSGVHHPVYCLGKEKTKPPILLLHELTGLSAGTLAYAETLSTDFTVYTPYMVGSFNFPQSYLTERLASFSGTMAFKFNGEWSGLENGTSKIVAWLRILTHKIEKTHPNQSIAIIGNCLTGALPLALIDDSKGNIGAIVVAQPALPLTFIFSSKEEEESLGVSPEDIEKSQRSDVSIYGVRFQKDKISPPGKFKTLKDHFGSRFINAEICDDEYLNEDSLASHENAHSTLIAEHGSGGLLTKASEQRREEVKSFLKDPSHFSRDSRTCGIGGGDS
jgi:dienelactone hydrolase